MTKCQSMRPWAMAWTPRDGWMISNPLQIPAMSLADLWFNRTRTSSETTPIKERDHSGCRGSYSARQSQSRHKDVALFQSPLPESEKDVFATAVWVATSRLQLVTSSSTVSHTTSQCLGWKTVEEDPGESPLQRGLAGAKHGLPRRKKFACGNPR